MHTPILKEDKRKLDEVGMNLMLLKFSKDDMQRKAYKEIEDKHLVKVDREIDNMLFATNKALRKM